MSRRPENPSGLNDKVGENDCEHDLTNSASKFGTAAGTRELLGKIRIFTLAVSLQYKS